MIAGTPAYPARKRPRHGEDGRRFPLGSLGSCHADRGAMLGITRSPSALLRCQGIFHYIHLVTETALKIIPDEEPSQSKCEPFWHCCFSIIQTKRPVLLGSSPPSPSTSLGGVLPSAFPWSGSFFTNYHFWVAREEEHQMVSKQLRYVTGTNVLGRASLTLVY